MNSSNKVAFNTLILFIRMGFTFILSLYTTRLVLSALGTEDFGIFNVVGGAVAMLTFLNVSMATATQRFMSYAEGQGQVQRKFQIFSVSIILHILIAFLIVIILEIVGIFLFNGIFNIPPDRIESAWLIYQFAIVSVFFTIVSVPYDAVINSHENMMAFAIISLIESILKLIIALILINTFSDKLTLYGSLMAGISFILLFIKVIYCSNRYSECHWQIYHYFSLSLFKEMTNFGGWNFLGTSSSMISNYGQGIILNTFFGAKINASHAISGQISGLLSALALNMQRALAPVIVKSEGGGNRVYMLRAAALGNKIGFFLLSLLFIPVLIEMPYLLKLWLVDVPEYVVVISRLLLIKALIEQLFINLGSTIHAVGNIKQYEITTSIFTACTLPICYLLYSFEFPIITLYVVFIINTVTVSMVTLLFVKKHCELNITHYFSNIVLRSVVSFIFIYFFSSLPLFFVEESLLRLLFITLIFVVTFFLSVWNIGLNKFERNIFKIKIVKLTDIIFLRFKKH